MATPLNLIRDGIVCGPISNFGSPKVVFRLMIGNVETLRVVFCWMIGKLATLRVVFPLMIGNFGAPKGRFLLDDWEIVARKWFSDLQ
jgi:hypothetical protein